MNEIKEINNIPETESAAIAVPSAETETAESLNDERIIAKSEEENAKEDAHSLKTTKKLMLFIPIVIAAVLTVLLPAFIFVCLCLRPITVEVCEVPDYSHITKTPLVSTLCKVDTELSELDTSFPCIEFVTLRFFGFIKLSSKVNVVDTVPPRITPTDVCITLGAPLEARMFAKETVDKTNVSFSFKGEEPDTSAPGKHTVTVRATDEGGNTDDIKATLTVFEKRGDFSFEYGTSNETIEKQIRSAFPSIGKLDLSTLGDCGIHTVTTANDTSFFLFEIEISDTVAPEAKIRSFDLLLGDTVTDDDIVAEITDFSAVTVEFLNPPDFSVPGEQKIDILITDEWGNASEFISYIRIHDINTNVAAEAKCNNNALSELIFKNSFSREALSFPKEHVTLDMPLGENRLNLSGKYNTIPVTIIVEDTIPPDFSTQSIRVLVGKTLTASDFVTQSNDTTKVTFSFEVPPPSGREGSFEVVIVARDLAGNTSKKSATVVFFVDRDPPVISGHRDLSLIIGESPLYLSGVSASDAVWGNINVQVDRSDVNLQRAGTYSVIYYATDGSGNTAKETVTLTVREPVRVCLSVSNIMQKPALPNGCEVVSLAIALKYAGHPVDPVYLYDTFMPKSPYKNGDPWETYVGNAKGKGIGCYAPCVVTTGNKYLAHIGSEKKVYDISGQSLSAYEKYIDNGAPIIMWGTINMNGNSSTYWRHTVNGKNVVWHHYSHCMVMIGYTDYTYIFCDPLKGIVEYSKADVEKSFNILFKQACIVQ